MPFLSPPAVRRPGGRWHLGDARPERVGGRGPRWQAVLQGRAQQSLQRQPAGSSPGIFCVFQFCTVWPARKCRVV